MKPHEIYLSGPMSGHPDLNRALFLTVADQLMRQGYRGVLIPHDVKARDHDGPCPKSYADGPEHGAACYLREDVIRMLRDCEKVFVLPGWESSVGARLEVNTAAACGMPVVFLSQSEIDGWRAAA